MKASSRFLSTRRARVIFVLMVALGATVLTMALSFAKSATAAVTASTSDVNGDGRIDTMTVTFSSPMDTTHTPVISSGSGHPGFWVEGYDVSAITWDSTPTTLKLSLVPGSAYDTAATPHVHYELGGNALSTIPGQDGDAEITAQDVASVDRAGPALVYAAAKDIASPNVFNEVGDSTRFTFSEPATLAGATPLVRWQNLERAFRITATTTGMCSDSVGTPGASFNFPQPGGTSADPILAPAGAAEFVSTFKITAQQGNSLSSAGKFPAAPFYCKIGVDPSYASLITDAANNVASSQDTGAVNSHMFWIQPGDIELTSARTIDGGHGSAPNGAIDAIELTFDQNLDDVTAQSEIANIHVALGPVDAIVDTGSLDTGTPGDRTFYARFTLPEGASWNTSVLPTVSYVKPASCTPTAGAGIKGNVPTPGYKACAASFDVTATDAAAPLLLNTRTMDLDGNGLLDHIRATFTEDIASTSFAGWKIDGRDATAFSTGASMNVADIAFPENTVGDTGTLPNVSYTRQGGTGTLDAAGNEIPTINQAANTDGAAPRIRVASVYDTNNDGSIDQVGVQYSETVGSPASDAASAYKIGESAGTGFAAGSDAQTLLVDVAPYEGTAPQALSFTPGSTPISDAAGNNATGQDMTASQVQDGAAPVGHVDILPGAPMSAGTKTVTAVFSEAMSTTAAPTATVGSKAVTAVADGDHTNGWRTADPSKWDGTVDIVAGDCAVPTGCAVDVTVDGAHDVANNAQAQPATMQTEIDTIAPAASTVGAFIATEQSGEDAPLNTVNMFTDSFLGTGAVAAGDAEHGTAEILVDGSTLTPGAKDTSIGASDTMVTPTSSFASRSALQSALAEGAHTVTIRLCDDAMNCTDSANNIGVTADYTPVSIDLTAPAGGDVVAGGSTLSIAWNGDDAGAGFDHTEIDYSTDNGATYTHAISHDRALDGTYDWTMPVTDVANAMVRVATVDANGNKGFDATAQSFSIDSSAPVVQLTSPSTANPFVAGSATIHWQATDASIDRVTNPITLQYSTDGGSHWNAINGGSYSHANDGTEVWNAPGAAFNVKVRVTAIDATNKSTTIGSGRLVTGVGGYVADRYGPIYTFGAADSSIHRSMLGRGEQVRGLVLRHDRTAGYEVSSKGIVYPFSIGSAPMPSKPSAKNLGSDLARGIVLRTDTSGYVLDAYGRIWAFGGAPAPHPSATFRTDSARAITMLPNGRGGYVLDSYGLLHPYSVGSFSKPASIRSSKLSSPRAVAVAMRSNGVSGWILDSTGRTTAFGGAASRSSSGVSSSAAAKSLVLVTQDAGYWFDGHGVAHTFGAAYGNPTRATLGSGRAAGAVG